MNIQEALDMTDRMKPNMMPRDMKIRYLQELVQRKKSDDLTVRISVSMIMHAFF